MKTTRCILILSLSLPFGATGYSDIDSFINEQKISNKKENDALREFTIMNQQEYRKWKNLQEKNYQEFKDDIEQRWGEFIESSRKCWVHYGKDRNSRGIVDFERGVVKVEVLGREEDALNVLSSKLSSAVKDIITWKAEVQEDSTRREPLLHELIPLSGKECDSSVDRFADIVTLKADLMVTPQRKKITVQFELVPDHIRRRARRYFPLIEKYCLKYNLSISHVMATVHTESLFNPLARSSSNALGLMQLVPETGGKDAFEFVYKIEGIPSPDILYDPEKNLELGCAYIYLLKSRHFGGVIDTNNNLYCSIAGFNTGPGNVAWAFTGKRELESAVKIINSFKSPDIVYAHLINNLPSYETRAYLKKVVDLMRIYK